MGHGKYAVVLIGSLFVAGCGLEMFKMENLTGGGEQPQMSFSQVDRDGDNNISRTEAEQAGMSDLVQNWSQADRDQDDVLDQAEFSTFTAQ